MFSFVFRVGNQPQGSKRTWAFRAGERLIFSAGLHVFLKIGSPPQLHGLYATFFSHALDTCPRFRQTFTSPCCRVYINCIPIISKSYLNLSTEVVSKTPMLLVQYVQSRFLQPKVGWGPQPPWQPHRGSNCHPSLWGLHHPELKLPRYTMAYWCISENAGDHPILEVDS